MWESPIRIVNLPSRLCCSPWSLSLHISISIQTPGSKPSLYTYTSRIPTRHLVADHLRLWRGTGLSGWLGEPSRRLISPPPPAITRRPASFAHSISRSETAQTSIWRAIIGCNELPSLMHLSSPTSGPASVTSTCFWVPWGGGGNIKWFAFPFSGDNNKNKKKRMGCGRISVTRDHRLPNHSHGSVILGEDPPPWSSSSEIPCTTTCPTLPYLHFGQGPFQRRFQPLRLLPKSF